MAISNYYLIPSLPEELKGLEEIGLDLRWSWSHASDTLWERIEPQLWKLTHNPWLILQSVPFSRLESLARDGDFIKQLDEQVTEHRQYLQGTSWFSKEHSESTLTIAYFSMEFGLSESLPIYSGGLGILAGDHLKTASDLGVPVIGVGLLFQQGYFRQVIDTSGNQNEFYPYNDPSQLPILPVRDSDGEWLRVEVTFPGRVVRLRAWEAKVGRARLYLLDSNDASNSPEDQCITTELYGGGVELRIQQEIVLGVGGWQLLGALGIKADVCHLNEGHAALAVIERAHSFMQDTGQPFDVAMTATRAGNIFTSHTPVKAGFDRFSPALVWQYLQNYVEQLGISFDDFMSLGRKDASDLNEPLNMAYMAIRGSCAVNGVSRLHGSVSRQIFLPLFPHWPQIEVPVSHVTNGVHVPSWDSATADELWHNACGKDRWLGTMDTLESELKCIQDDIIWKFRNEKCRQLVKYVRERLTRQLEASGISRQEAVKSAETLNPDTFTIGFARRFTSYKRPNLLLYDTERLIRILRNPSKPVQLIIAGKAHPRDEAGKDLIRDWSDFIRYPEIHSHVVFLADYDMLLAEQLVHGIDLWINTPRRPFEASGTSGMKVLVNGGLNLSELDGWWAEAYRPEVGWALGDGREHGDDPNWDAKEAQQFYNILEQQVIPEFYDRDSNGIPRAWVNRIRLSMAELTPRFSTNRMIREYVERLYLPAALAYQDRIANKSQKAASLSRWRRNIQSHWNSLRFGNLEVRIEKDQYTFKIPVYPGELTPELIDVQLFAESPDNTQPEIYRMVCANEIHDPEKGYSYIVEIPVKRKAVDYTPRIIPAFEGASVPIEEPKILWYR